MKVGEKVVVFIVLELVWCCTNSIAAGASAPSLWDKCSNDFQEVTSCLTFVTGKHEDPSKECCISLSDIKEKDPVCLCYIIQQIHTGNDSLLKSMGIQEARLLQLSSACHLHGASIADCPELMKLPPNSPDAAFFTNSSTSATPSTATTATSATAGTSSSTGHEISNGFKPPAKIGGIVLAIGVAIFLSIFPGGGRIWTLL